MPTLAEQDLTGLFDDLYDYLGVDIEVTRGISAPVTLRAVKGTRGSNRVGDEDFYGTAIEGDFIVKAQDYITTVGGEPERFDYIEWMDDIGILRRAQVGLDGVERHWDPADHTNVLWRIHTTDIPLQVTSREASLAVTLADTLLDAEATTPSPPPPDPANGTLDVTLGSTLLEATGMSVVEGELAVTLEDATLAASGTVIVRAELVVRLGDTTLISSGGKFARGYLDVTLEDTTLSSVGEVVVSGSLATVIEDTMLDSTASLKPINDGTVDVTLEDTTLVAAAVVPGHGTVDVTLEDTALEATVVAPRTGTVGVTLDDTTLAATAISPRHGTVDVTIENTTLDAWVSTVPANDARLPSYVPITAGGEIVTAGGETVTLSVVTIEDTKLTSTATVGT